MSIYNRFFTYPGHVTFPEFMGASHSEVSTTQSAHHGSCNAHWSVHRLATTSDKSIKMWILQTLVINHSYAYKKRTPQKQVCSASAQQASHCSRSFTCQSVLLSLLQASCHGRSFPSQLASSLSVALASRLLQELCMTSRVLAGSQSPGYHKEDRWPR
jgi:hypothetical protein